MKTAAEVDKALVLVEGLYSVLHAAHPRGVPSGHLYAAVMDRCDLGTYQVVVDLMVQAGMVRRGHGHVLTANLPGGGG